MTAKKRNTPTGPQRRDAAGAVLEAGDDRRVRFLASSAAVDRHGTVITPEGIRCEAFDRNPTFVWSHQTGGWQRCEVEDVLGKVIQHEVTARGFEVVVEFTTADINPKAERAYRAVQAGLLGSVSIGFAPLKMHWEEREGGEVMVYDEVDLLEVSLVIVGSNPEAVALRSLFAAPQQRRAQRRAMDKSEALKVLGLDEGASEDEIKAKLDEMHKALGIEPHAGDENEEIKGLRAAIEEMQRQMEEMRAEQGDEEEAKERAATEWVERQVKAGYPESSRGKLLEMRKSSPKAAETMAETVIKSVASAKRQGRQFGGGAAKGSESGAAPQDVRSAVKGYVADLWAGGSK